MNDESIFAKALEFEPGEQRDHFLDSACGPGTDQRSRIDRLLGEHDNPDSFLNPGAQPNFKLETTTGGDDDALVDRETIENFRLLHVLGEGGMGTVFLAEQQHPVRRRVAVKVIKHGMNTRQFVARFEAERQALAMMDHPNIAKVLDAGCTADGRPYFVMELVKGMPITDFCDQNRLTTAERLALFVQVCQAVQHAHQKGIIHRDLKPSNVLVAMYDNHPVPKVIDFGVAKTTQQPLTEHTLCTIPGQIVGTWEYMSPEQAILNQLDVDTRTDIYSLGVILYELLTGKTPLDLKSLQPEALEERLRRIREEEPSRPSLRVSSLGQVAAAAMATYRNAEATDVARSLKGDLDWIVMKALEKDRANRYETASGFGAEIGRYLNDEPISFRPPSSWDQLSRTLRRHKAFVTSTLLTIAVLMFGLVLTFWQYRVAERQRVMAERRLGVVKDYTMVLARSGNPRDLALAINAARLVGASELWEVMLQAQSALESGETEKAVGLLKEGMKRANEPELLACKGLLCSALIIAGRTDELLVAHKELLAANPNTVEELVFVSQGVAIDSKLSWELANRAVGLRDSPLAKLNRAIASMFYGIDTGDLGVVEQGIDDLKSIEQSAIETPYTIAFRLQLHLAAMTIAELNGAPVEKWRPQAELDISELEKHDRYGWGLLTTAWYKDRFAGNVEDSDAAWEAVLQRGSGGWHDLHAAAMILRKQSLAEWSGQLRGKDTLERVALASLLACESGAQRDQAMEIYDEIAERRKIISFRAGTGFDVPLLAKEVQRVRDEANEILDGGSQFLTSFDREAVCYLADRISRPQFVEKLSSCTRTEQLMGHCLIATKSLAEEDIELAKRHFRECRKTGVFHTSDYFWAKAFLERLENVDANASAAEEQRGGL
ncbi:MAG: serine/threonine protein kinase [Planctomycetales bacterium]|nr:serine/threonine protein kinase [Planctomycetales bacterium]